MKSKGVTAETKNPIKPIGKTGASSGLNLGVRGRASVSSGAKGKAIVSDNAGKVPSDSLLLDEAEIAASRRVELLVQTHDDPVMKLYLWDKAAFEFYEKFKASGGTARVILVTTLNPKRFGGVLSLSAMASSQVFLDSDVQETLFYLSWLNSNLDVASRVNAEVVTKPEPATLGELFSYMNQASAKVGWFECTATIDGVVHCSGWYYIGCGVCHTKATKGPTTLMCKKCGKSEIIGVAQYLTKLSVYDRNDQAVFVVLGDAGEELTGKKAAVLVERYYQANDSVGGDHIVSVPQAMIDTIGQTRKFIVKVSNHNLTAKTQTLTVTKVLPLEAPKPEGNLRENVGEEADTEREDHADESVKRGADGIESEGVKRAKCPGSDLMMKNRLRLLYAVANRKKISFGHLVYDQVIDMTRKTDWDTNLIFPNLIYQVLMLQKEVPLLPGDEEPIGKGLRIYGVSGDTSGPRGRRRLN
ncbi:hypothetical protein Bca101_036818 [Brassica carinata]